MNSPIATVEMMKKVFERQRRPYGLPLPVINGIIDGNGVGMEKVGFKNGIQAPSNIDRVIAIYSSDTVQIYQWDRVRCCAGRHAVKKEKVCGYYFMAS